MLALLAPALQPRLRLPSLLFLLFPWHGLRYLIILDNLAFCLDRQFGELLVLGNLQLQEHDFF